MRVRFITYARSARRMAQSVRRRRCLADVECTSAARLVVIVSLVHAGRQARSTRPGSSYAAVVRNVVRLATPLSPACLLAAATRKGRSVCRSDDGRSLAGPRLGCAGPGRAGFPVGRPLFVINAIAARSAAQRVARDGKL